MTDQAQRDSSSSSDLLSLEDLSEVIAAADQLSSLSLSVQMASQVVVSDESGFPEAHQLDQLPLADASVLRNLWQVARQRQADLTWTQLLTQLESVLKIADTAVVTVKVPYQATGEQLAELAQIIKSKTNSPVFLNPLFQPELQLGCIIEYQGQRSDFTSDARLQTYLDQAAAAIAQPSDQVNPTTSPTTLESFKPAHATT